MKQSGTANKVFECAMNEDVTLSFTPRNATVGITYRFRGDQTAQIVQGNKLVIPIDKDILDLSLFFHFVNSSGTGGSCKVKLSGSLGGSFTDPQPALQTGNLVPIKSYIFFV